MKYIMISSLIILLAFSCGGGFGIDSSIQTKNVDFDESDIVGTWKLDKFSYKYLSGKENFDSIYITFKSDSTFEMNNSTGLFTIKNDSIATRDFIDGKNPAFSDGKIDNTLTNGHWKINHIKMPNYNITNLHLIYDDNSTQSGLNVYKKGDEFQIWYFFGDPDTGERLRFLKE